MNHTAAAKGRQAGRIRIGISGWRYAGWRGIFYPKGLPQRRELEFAAQSFETVEINGTFYSLQRPESFTEWTQQTPEDFVFAVKGSRFITHMLKLREVRVPLANFFGSGVLRLGAKFGPLLWQFAPQMRFDRERFETFFKLLPRSHREAAALMRRHADRRREDPGFRVKRDAPLRHSVEIRHESFVVPEFVELLRQHDIGLVVADTVEWPLLMDVSSNFVYCRLHGSEQLYTSGYGEAALDEWAERVLTWAQGGQPAGRRADAADAEVRPRDVYVYFDNDAKVRAPFDAQGLRERVGALARERGVKLQAQDSSSQGSVIK
ncbi:DUF72 domain-containing protein [Edaphobacter modestus]|uniref:Uncharacterized protein YecE (DUF72 family) n=1 Tax=Edaphobacter modestus TaxID=388466 RepID=A0A4Q7YTQ3_9BACT|nr:DUF72 domain-containing protein [Edaphobacter modestus]RZU40940.1 uncharacterized protein YecE (DUF72 family) [Edaphobacter modestus]